MPFAKLEFILIFVKIISLTISTEHEENPRQVSLRDLGTLGDFRPGNGIVAQALLSVSRRSAHLHRPQGAVGFSPPKPLAWGCYPQTPSSLRAFHPIFLLQNSMRIVFAGTSAGGCPYDLRGKSDEWNACSCAPGRTAV